LFCSKHGIALYATAGTFEAMPKREDREIEWVRVRAGDGVRIGRMRVDLFPTPHDAADPVGFRVRRGMLGFGHVTDLGHISEAVVDGLRGCAALLIESNHDTDMLRESEYPASIRSRVASRLGHLSNDALAGYLERRLPDGVRHLFLAHLSQQNNHERLALECCFEALRRRGGRMPRVHLTYADRPTPLLRLAASKTTEIDPAQRVLAFEPVTGLKMNLIAPC
jgi:phosphoribosyl 1,2-cyclic phosphodiesterase